MVRRDLPPVTRAVRDASLGLGIAALIGAVLWVVVGVALFKLGLWPPR